MPDVAATPDAPGTGGPAAPTALESRNFRLLWIGETTSHLGNALTTVLLPLIAVLELHASAFAVSLISVAVWLPWVAFGLVAGAWADRLPNRTVMVTCDVGAAIVFLSVPIAAAMDRLTLVHLLLVALITGTAAVFFSTSYHVFIPRLLSPERRVRGNARLQASESATRIAGPGLAGLLTRAFGATTGLAIDAFTFLMSAACLVFIRGVEETSSHDTSNSALREEIVAGLRFVQRDAYLKWMLIYGVLTNLALEGYAAIQIVYLVRTLGVDPALVGVLIAAGGAGGVLGALTVGAVTQALGTARGMLLIVLVTGPFALLIPLSGPGAGLMLFAIGTLVVIAGVVAGNIVLDTFRQSYTPPEMLGRVVASSLTISYAAIPVGALIGGILSVTVGVQTAMWLTCSLLAVTGTTLLASPLRGLRDLPTRVPS